MAVPKTTHWKLEPHTRAKHLILRRYLEAWLPIMARHNGRIVLIDGFAGPGRYLDGEDGSPLIALKALLEHPAFKEPRPNRTVSFAFIEQDKERHAALDAEVSKIKRPDWLKLGVVCGDFAAAVTHILDDVDQRGAQLAPTFVFIDPFGFAGVPMDLVARILKNRRCECLITFMFESINRFIAHPEPGIQSHFDELFGTEAWRGLLQLPTGPERQAAIMKLYRSQLIARARAEYVRTFEMIDHGNKTEYFLFFASHSETGLSKMKQAMWRADPTGGQMFSDRTVSDQMVLLEPEADLSLLRRLLAARLKNAGWVSIEDIERFVLVETPFSEAMHLKKATLAPMERDGTVAVQRAAAKRAIPGQYPEGTKIRAN